LNYQNNCATLKPVAEYQNFLQRRSLLLRFQQNYFDATKIFSDQYPAKFLDSSAKTVLSV